MAHSKWQTEQEFLENPKWWHVTRPTHFGVAVAILIASITLVWYFWTPEAIKDEDIPIIKVQPGPTRIRPDNPGAPEIAHQDKLIYDELTSKKDRDDTVTVRAQPEEPMDIEPPKEEVISAEGDNFPIANLDSSQVETSGVVEEPRFEIVVAPKKPEKEVSIAVPEIEKETAHKEPVLKSLPLKKLFALNDVPSQPSKKSKSSPKVRTKAKPKGRAKKRSAKKPFPILPIPKSMLYANKQKRLRQQQRGQA